MLLVPTKVREQMPSKPTSLLTTSTNLMKSVPTSVGSSTRFSALHNMATMHSYFWGLGLRFRVEGLGLRAWGLGFGVSDFRLKV